MRHSISFVLDGQLRVVEFGPGQGLRPTTTLLQYLRSLPGHTGTKEGCAEGDCGACTVVLAEPDGAALRYTAVDSCLVFLPMVHGRQVITVENLRSPAGLLHPVQQALVDLHGSQCGFCTPGIAMTLFALFRSGRRWTEQEIRTALAGNLCRCTGYRPIIDAALRALEGSFSDHVSEGEQVIREMLLSIPADSIDLSGAGFRYLRPATLAEALALRAEHRDALILHGATDIALRVTKNHASLPKVLDISGVRELSTIRDDGGVVEAGSGVSLARLGAFCAQELPALADCTALFASMQIRALATIGGNIGTASPVGDLLPVLMAYGAEVELTGPAGRRMVDASSFVTGYRTTACAPDELITAVRIRRPAAGTLLRWYKVSRRRDVDIATVSAALRLDLDGGGKTAGCVLAFGGMADRTARARNTETFLLGRPWTRVVAEQAMTVLDREFTPLTDVRGSSRFRQTAARNLLMKFWLDTSPAGAGSS